MSLFQKRSGGPFPEPVIPPFPGVSVFGGSVASPDQALRIASVWAAVRLLADSVSMMPLHAYAADRSGQRVPMPDPPLLVSPYPRTTPQDWIYMVMVSLLLRGNAYGFIAETDRRGYPTSIELLDPAKVQVFQDKDTKQTTYRFDGVQIDPMQMWHVRAFPTPGSMLGLSPIQYAARTLGIVAATETFAEQFFTDGAHPSSILTTDQPVSQEQAGIIKSRFQGAVNGREPVVIGAGLKWQQVQISPEEAQFLESQEFGVNQIARIFGIPAEMIGGSTKGSNVTYANVTQRAMDFLTYSVQPWLTRLESAIFPLLPGADHVRFDTSTLVRLDASTKWNVGKIRLEKGAATINEVRAEEGLSAVPWGETPYLPSFPTSSAMTVVQAEVEDGDSNDSTQ